MPEVWRSGRKIDFLYGLQPQGRWLVQHRLLPKDRGSKTGWLCRWRVLRRIDFKERKRLNNINFAQKTPFFPKYGEKGVIISNLLALFSVARPSFYKDPWFCVIRLP
jgi:hypothetical protein